MDIEEGGYERRVAHTATLMTTATNTSATRAYKQRLAHLSSAVRMRSMMTWRSASVFSGSHAAEGVAAGGARSGDSRMITPIIQKGGNTGQDVRILEGANLKNRRTESEFEQVHG